MNANSQPPPTPANSETQLRKVSNLPKVTRQVRDRTKAFEQDFQVIVVQADLTVPAVGMDEAHGKGANGEVLFTALQWPLSEQQSSLQL